jgi:hypothetical protein
MVFEITGLLILFHVLFASLWFGGAVYQVRVVGGTLMQAGPAASGFMLALARRGGIGKYFAVMGALTIVFGGIVYGQEKVSDHAFDMAGGFLWLTLGAIMAVLAYLHGLLVQLPTERKWLAVCNGVKGAPTKEQGEQMMALGMKLGKGGAVSTAMIGVAMLLMLMHQVLV